MKLERIHRVLNETIEDVHVQDKGEDFFVLEINHTWMFRFPRHVYAEQALACEKKFLPLFARLSPLAIPNPCYIGEDFIGYRKIEGEFLTRELFDRLSLATRRVIAQQMGEFLSLVHSFPINKARAMGVTESWGGWRRRAFESFKQDVAPRLSAKARDNALLFFDRFFKMDYPRALIHGDFYPPDHVLFDVERQQLSGVIDFGDLTIEDSATDLKSIYSDFGVDFFHDVLAHYSRGADDQLVERIQMRMRAYPLFDAAYALEYHQPERFERQLAAIELDFGGKANGSDSP